MNKGHHVLFKGELSKSIIMVERGCLEVYAIFEGNEFIFDRLNPGSILNHRGFFSEDIMHVNVRCSVDTVFCELTMDMIDNLIYKYPSLKKELLLYQNKILRQKMQRPLDYIIFSNTCREQKEVVMTKI